MNYITKVKVQNFFSIKEEITLDFSASEYSINYNKDRLFKKDSNYTNKLLAFYGANASGKTTILKSIVWFAYFISNSNQKEFPTAHSNIYAEKGMPSFIELYFLHEDREFSYRLDLNYDKFSNIKSVKNEILKIKVNNKYVILFNKEKEIFKSLDFENNNSLLFDELSPNSSLLNESLSRMKDYRSLYNLFIDITNNSNISGTYHIDLDVDENDTKKLSLLLATREEFKQIFEHFKEEMDESFVEHSLKFNNFLFRVLSLIGTDIKTSKVIINTDKEKEVETRLNLIHQVNTNKYLAFELESNGSKMLIKLIHKVFETYINKSILIVDELDSLVHPLIVPILNLLTIKLNIQMLYSTHNISNMKYLYNDELYLIEKDENHNTQIKDLKEYDGYANFEKLYRNSLLGAVPNIENINFDFLDDLEEVDGK